MHRDCAYKLPVVFHNLKNYDSPPIMQELDKFNLKTNVIPNGLEKYTSFTINNNSRFIYSFRFLSSLLDSLVKNLSKDDFKYLSQEFDNVLHLVKKKVFHPYEYMSDFEKPKEELPSKKKFYSSLSFRKITDKEYEHVLNVLKKFEMKTMKDYHDGIPSMLARVARVAKVSERKVSDHSNLKILRPKQMHQIMPIALAQLKAGNTSENLLNEIRQSIYSLHRAKGITKNLYNNIKNSIKL